MCLFKFDKNNNNKINPNKPKPEIIFLKEYIKYINIFNWKEIAKFLEYKSRINYKIKFLLGKKLLYKLLYNISELELTILKDYIKTNLISKFI